MDTCVISALKASRCGHHPIIACSAIWWKETEDSPRHNCSPGVQNSTEPSAIGVTLSPPVVFSSIFGSGIEVLGQRDATCSAISVAWFLQLQGRTEWAMMRSSDSGGSSLSDPSR